MWTLRDAWRLVAGWSELATACGYVLALHGSVLLKGKGGDVDLIALPTRKDPMSIMEFVWTLANTLPPECREVQRSPAVIVPHATGYQIWTGGKMIDLLVLEV